MPTPTRRDRAPLPIGSITALLLIKYRSYSQSESVKQTLTYIGIALIVLPMIIFDKNSSFPGYNALWRFLGTALVISFPNNGFITRFLSHKWMVFVGLISYPLYLYHQPLISFIYFYDFKLSSFEMFLAVTLISTVCAWLTYKFIEVPFRQLALRSGSKKSLISVDNFLSSSIIIIFDILISPMIQNIFSNLFYILLLIY